MNVLVSTVPRSGSTLLFNMCRLLFEKAHGVENTYANWCQFHQKEKEKKYNVIKIHNRDAEYTNWSNKILTSIRDIRYIIASYADFNKKFKINDPTNMRNVCKGFLQILDSNCKVSDYIFKYEDYLVDPYKIVSDVTRCLEIPLEKIKPEEIVKQLEKIKNAKYNSLDRQKTQMHPNHISPKTNSHITDRLTIEQLHFIESNFAWFFEKYNYPIISLIKMM